MPAAVSTPHVSVVVCTWNRAASLARTLERMTRLAVPHGEAWELVVVDNRCTDDTPAVIASFAGRLPIRRIGEPEPGLAHARNRGVAESRGEHVVFTDDDVLVDEGWLAAYRAAFRRWPTASVFGGPIEPEFEGAPPAWIPRVLDAVGAVYGRQTLGDAPVALTPERVGDGPYGGNMAMRRDALLRFPFDARLGVRHGEYAIGEETDAIRRMLAAGLTGWWSPEPRVRHCVPRESQTEAHVRRWMVGRGRFAGSGDAAVAGAGARARLRTRLLYHEARYAVHRRTSPPEVWMRHLVRASYARGRLLAATARAGR